LVSFVLRHIVEVFLHPTSSSSTNSSSTPHRLPVPEGKKKEKGIPVLAKLKKEKKETGKIKYMQRKKEKR